MMRFTLPRDMYYGKGALEHLKTLKGKKAIVVLGGGSMKRFGFVDKVLAYLKEAGIETQLFEGVEPDPSVETVMKGAQAMRDFEPDWIIAMGGGSPIDAAKAMGVLNAIVDPDLAETMPPTLTAHTGMDALTHAIEAYVSTLNSPFTDPLALKAINMVFEYLPDSYNGCMASREQMHYAQCLAGQAFSNALLGIVHSMAHKTGAAFSTGHIPHGCANAIYLPYVIQYNAKDQTAKERYAAIARSVGITGSDSECVAKLCKKIDEYNVKLNIPKTLQEFGIVEAEFKEKVAKIAELAVGDACTGSNPRAITPAEMEKLLTCTYYGTAVEF